MRKTIILLLIVIHYSDCLAQPKLFVIGVVHSENKYRKADSLIDLLKAINPDLILLETDTLSGYFGRGYRLRNPSWWYKLASKLRLVKKDTTGDAGNVSVQIDRAYR